MWCRVVSCRVVPCRVVSCIFELDSTYFVPVKYKVICKMVYSYFDDRYTSLGLIYVSNIGFHQIKMLVGLHMVYWGLIMLLWWHSVGLVTGHKCKQHNVGQCHLCHATQSHVWNLITIHHASDVPHGLDNTCLINIRDRVGTATAVKQPTFRLQFILKHLNMICSYDGVMAN